MLILTRHRACFSSLSTLHSVRGPRRPRRLLRKFGLGLTGAILCTGLLSDFVEHNVPAYASSSLTSSLIQTLISLRRFARSSSAAFVIAADYKWLFANHNDYTTDEYKNARSLVHSRSAERLVRLCNAQGSIYVKMGQHLASVTGIPLEYTEPMKSLQDRAEPSPFEVVLPMLEKEIGPAAERFEFIDPKPVAAASLAQVHRCRLKENTRAEVALKIQHPGLKEKVASDLATVSFLSFLLAYVFGGFDTTWLVKAFRTNLAQEMDFRLEAVSGQRAAQNFAGEDRVIVPKVYVGLSTDKVLAMEFIDGARVDDLNYMEEHGIDKQKVASAVVDAFAQMVFVDGFVHCDGHPGNLMVRAKPESAHGFELVILDHGLYRELADSFRKAYCLLWRGLITRSDADVKRACAELGTPGLEELFALALLHRRWASVKDSHIDIRKRMTKEEMMKLRDQFRSGDIQTEKIKTLPYDLLLILKMNSLVRNINKALGASVDRFRVNCRYAVRGLHHETHNEGADLADSRDEPNTAERGLAAVQAEWVDRFAVETRLLVLDMLLTFHRFWIWIRGTSNG